MTHDTTTWWLSNIFTLWPHAAFSWAKLTLPAAKFKLDSRPCRNDVRRISILNLFRFRRFANCKYFHAYHKEWWCHDFAPEKFKRKKSSLKCLKNHSRERWSNPFRQCWDQLPDLLYFLTNILFWQDHVTCPVNSLRPQQVAKVSPA